MAEFSYNKIFHLVPAAPTLQQYSIEEKLHRTIYQSFHQEGGDRTDEGVALHHRGGGRQGDADGGGKAIDISPDTRENLVGGPPGTSLPGKKAYHRFNDPSKEVGQTGGSIVGVFRARLAFVRVCMSLTIC